MKSVIYFASLIVFASIVLSMRSSKQIEGYPTGLIPDCERETLKVEGLEEQDSRNTKGAGSTKEAIITKKSLKHLTFTIQGPGPAIMARRVRYNYHQMKLLPKDPDFDFRRRTVVYAVGYLDTPAFPAAWIIAKHYKDIGYNTLLLDTNFFTTTYYPRAARFMRPVGKHVAEMLAELTKMGLKPKKLELIGVSLGGQTISYIAKNYRLITGFNVSRVTALDPSGPCFRNLGPEDRIDQSDADFVELVATNIDGYGLAAPIGHSNFYINGGEYQPGPIIYMPCTDFCSHIRSISVWLSSLYHQDSFIAIKCNSVQQARNRDCYDNEPRVTNLFGPKTNKSIQGVFYLATTNEDPYYLAEKGLVKKDNFYDKAVEDFNAEDVITI